MSKPEFEIYTREYSGEEVIEMMNDIEDAFQYDEFVKNIPVDKYGFSRGTFKVCFTWKDD